MQFNETGVLISFEDAKLLLMVAVATNNKTLLGMEDIFQWVMDIGGISEVFPNGGEMTALRYMYDILPELRP
jgi:hypothetical protein